MELIDLVSSYKFCISQMTLLGLITFLLGSSTVTLTVLLFWIYFFCSDASIFSTKTFPLLRNSNHVVVWVSINSPSNSKQDVLFHCIAFDYSHADWDALCDHLRDVQTPLGARLGLGTQPRYEPPCDLRAEIVQTQWLTSSEWGCPLYNCSKLAVGQPNSN